MDSFVQVAPDSSGKKIQTFEGTVSTETVEAQSVVLVDETLAPYQPLTDDELRASAVPVDGSGVTQPISAAALPLPSGAASEATLGGVLTTSDFDSKTGALTETAPATDTASSGLNGRLQRIAQRLTSLIAIVAGTLTTKEVRASTPAQSSVANATSSTSLLAANANRLGATFFNDDTANTGASVKLKLGATASATSFSVIIAPQGYYEVPFLYTGAIDGIASAATGSMRITELTA